MTTDTPLTALRALYDAATGPDLFAIYEAVDRARIVLERHSLSHQMDWTPDNIRELRKAHGLTQQQLADHLDTHVNTVREWEQGRKTPSTKNNAQLQQLAERM